MTNKTLGWWAIGILIAFVLAFAGEPDAPITNMLAIAYLGVNIWTGIRLINS